MGTIYGRRLVAVLSLLLLLVGIGSAAAQEREHILERGETLYTLARRYGVDVETIQVYNKIADPTQLPVGARILIPGTYTVSEGEYIYSIARQLDIDWMDLLAANNLQESDVVRPGDVLLIPYTRPDTGASPLAVAEAVEANAANNSHTSDVQAGGAGDPTDTNATTGGVSHVESVPLGSSQWPHPGVRELVDGKFPGMVMRGELGDAFWSVARGVVTLVLPYSGYGKYILVRGGDGFIYGYGGAERVSVELGDRVEPGTVLGTLGFSSALQSTSLLFTVWKNNRYVDPETAPRG